MIIWWLFVTIIISKLFVIIVVIFSQFSNSERLIWWLFYGLFDANNPNNLNEEKTKCKYPDHNLQLIWHLTWVIICQWHIWCLLDDFLVLIGWLLNDYLIINFDDYCVYLTYLINICRNMQSEWLTQFAFVGLCFLKIPVVRPARPTNAISDLFDSSLKSVPRAFRRLQHPDGHNVTVAWVRSQWRQWLGKWRDSFPSHTGRNSYWGFRASGRLEPWVNVI